MLENILDASAILAVLQNEIGKEKVEPILDKSAVSRVNVTEVLTKLVEKGMSVGEAKQAFDDLDLKIIEFDENQSLESAELRPLTKHLGLSLGDRCCLALALLENATAVTADRDWAKLNVCPIKLIR